MSNSPDYDVLIVGAGPAGSAAAIHAARNGLKVGVVERLAFPRDLPGEALHPDIEPLFEQLGVSEEVADSGFIRYPGWLLERSGERTFMPFLGPLGHLLFGYQAWRSQLDSILLAQARRMGAQILQPSNAVRALGSANRVIGLQLDSGPLFARYVVDATGATRWLSRQLGLPSRAVSPRLIARYGYFPASPSWDLCPSSRKNRARGPGWPE